VVDDEFNARYVVTRLLAYEGVRAIGAAHGAEALALLAEHPVALILCDVRMPVMDGPTLLRELVARGLPRPPLIFLTAFSENADADLLALGACAVWSKPLEVSLLLDLVRAYVGAPVAA
jgi:CheY-like chemotaxis protein